MLIKTSLNEDLSTPYFGKIITEGQNRNDAFKKIFSVLKDSTDITYLVYILQNLGTNETIILSSNNEWGKVYLQDNLLYQCKLIKFAGKYFTERRSGTLLTIWNKIPISCRDEMLIDGMRNEFNISNGISYTHQYANIREAISIAAEPKHKDFYRQFSNNNSLDEIVKSLRLAVNTKG